METTISKRYSYKWDLKYLKHFPASFLFQRSAQNAVVVCFKFSKFKFYGTLKFYYYHLSQKLKRATTRAVSNALSETVGPRAKWSEMPLTL